MKSFGSDGLWLTWEDHYSNMVEFFKMVHETKEFADVTIIVQGGQLRAHRIVMGMISEYLDEMLMLQDGKEFGYLLVMPDITLKEMQWLLEYMYRGSIIIERSNLESLMKVAGKLKIKGLFVQNDLANRTLLPADNQPIRNEMPPAFEPEMPLTSLHQFHPTLTQTSQSQSTFTNALNPSLSYTNSIPLHNLVSYFRSFGSQQLFPPFVPNLVSTPNSAIPSISQFNQNETKRNVIKKRKRKPLNDSVESDRSSVSSTDKSETSANNIISPIVANNFCDVELTDLSIISGPSSNDTLRTQYFLSALINGMPSSLPTRNPLQNSELLAQQQCDNTNVTLQLTTKKENKSFECKNCDRSYSSSGNLNRHKKYECGVPPAFSCQNCNKMYRHRQSLKMHRKFYHKY